MGKDQRRRDGVNVDGPWIPMPLRFLSSRCCAELSPHAAKLLLDLIALLRPGAAGNGDLWASADQLAARGWSSEATRTAAMKELRAVGLVVITRRRSGRRCELIAITLWPLACDQKKLDPGHARVQHTMVDYRGTGDRMLAPPTPEAPAAWRKTRPAEKKMYSRHGCESSISHPLRGDKVP